MMIFAVFLNLPEALSANSLGLSELEPKIISFMADIEKLHCFVLVIVIVSA